MARKINPGAEQRIAEVTLSMDGKRLVFVFESGEGYSILRGHLPGDDGSPITAIQIFDHRHAVAVSQGSGMTYDLPWDSIKHYARGGKQKKLSVGFALQRLRKSRGMSQQALAKSAGISRMQLSRLEANRSNPTMDTLLKLANVLEIAPAGLMETLEILSDKPLMRQLKKADEDFRKGRSYTHEQVFKE